MAWRNVARWSRTAFAKGAVDVGRTPAILNRSVSKSPSSLWLSIPGVVADGYAEPPPPPPPPPPPLPSHPPPSQLLPKFPPASYAIAMDPPRTDRRASPTPWLCHACRSSRTRLTSRVGNTDANRRVCAPGVLFTAVDPLGSNNV